MSRLATAAHSDAGRIGRRTLLNKSLSNEQTNKRRTAKHGGQSQRVTLRFESTGNQVCVNGLMTGECGTGVLVCGGADWGCYRIHLEIESQLATTAALE